MNHPEDQDPSIDAPGPGGIFDALVVAAYGLPPTPISPRDLNPLLRPLAPVPTITTDQTAPAPAPNAPAGGPEPSPASVVMAITFIKRHFNLALPPQDSRVQALAELLDLAFDVGASR